MILLVGIFSILYIWFALHPGRVNPAVLQYFSFEEVERGREYGQLPRLLFITGFLLQLFFLLWLVFSGWGGTMSRWAQQLTGSYWGGVLVFFLVLWLAMRLIRLPFNFINGYYWQHKWGFSTQTMSSWWLDYFKGAGLELALSAIGVLLLFWVLGRFPKTWWLVGAAFISVWVIIQSYLWPVLVSPLFNRFEVAKDPAVVSMVQELSEKADIPVDQVLVMDASQRTTRANAYFAGLGQTKRIVLYDTLLENYPPEQVKAVVAHEMAHWGQGHITRGIALGIAGNFIVWGLLFIVLRGAVISYMRYPPYTWAVIMLFFVMISFISSPIESSISRSMEREADQVSVELTQDAQAAIDLQVALASKNLSDLSPPAFITWFSYSHPPALERIKLIEQMEKVDNYIKPGVFIFKLNVTLK
nr:M48 family metallopeptidase [Desulforamulus aquiferis]